MLLDKSTIPYCTYTIQCTLILSLRVLFSFLSKIKYGAALAKAYRVFRVKGQISGGGWVPCGIRTYNLLAGHPDSSVWYLLREGGISELQVILSVRENSF